MNNRIESQVDIGDEYLVCESREKRMKERRVGDTMGGVDISAESRWTK